MTKLQLSSLSCDIYNSKPGLGQVIEGPLCRAGQGQYRECPGCTGTIRNTEVGVLLFLTSVQFVINCTCVYTAKLL